MPFLLTYNYINSIIYNIVQQVCSSKGFLTASKKRQKEVAMKKILVAWLMIVSTLLAAPAIAANGESGLTGVWIGPYGEVQIEKTEPSPAFWAWKSDGAGTPVVVTYHRQFCSLAEIRGGVITLVLNGNEATSVRLSLTNSGTELTEEASSRLKKVEEEKSGAND